MTEPVVVSTPLTNAQQIVDKINNLQACLQQNLPNYESLLHTIHVALSKDEECMILLTPEQVGVICAGLSKKKNIVIATSTSKTGNKTVSGKKLGEVTLDDLGG